MQVHHDELHLGIVDGPLRRSTPSLFRARIVREHADDLDRLEVGEFKRLRIGDSAAEDEVELAQASFPGR